MRQPRLRDVAPNAWNELISPEHVNQGATLLRFARVTGVGTVPSSLTGSQVDFEIGPKIRNARAAISMQLEDGRMRRSKVKSVILGTTLNLNHGTRCLTKLISATWPNG